MVGPAIRGVLAQSARHTGTDWSRNYVSYPHRGEVRRLTPAVRLQEHIPGSGFTDVEIRSDQVQIRVTP